MKEQIMQRMNITEKQAEKLAEKLKGIDPSLEHILNQWFSDGIEDNDEEFEGYSVNSLKKQFGMSFTGAILTLDWLVRDPQIAKAAILKGIK